MTLRRQKVKVGIISVAAALTCLYVITILWKSYMWNTGSRITYSEIGTTTVPPSLYAEHLNETQPKDPEIEELLQVLQTRLRKYAGPKDDWTKSICHKNTGINVPCFDTTCPSNFSFSPRERLKQLLSMRTAPPAKYLRALTSAARSVTSHKYIFVTGASSNHYRESEVFHHMASQFLVPRMEGADYALVVYDLGLTEKERNQTRERCRCTVLDFPFSDLPNFIQELMCYIWKPLIVASLLEKAEYLIWADSSIQFRNSDPLHEIFQRAKKYGMQVRYNDGPIAVRTHRKMAKFFGDQLCQYSQFSEVEGNFLVFYNDRFTREVILKPWVACAFSRDCMCFKHAIKFLMCGVIPAKRIYQRCHRFDQSALGMILSKLYLESRPMVLVPGNNVKISRGTHLP